MESQQVQGKVSAFKNMDVVAPKKSDPSRPEFEYPKIIKGNLGPIKL